MNKAIANPAVFRIFSELMRDLEQGSCVRDAREFTLPVSAYCDPAHHRVEMEKAFAARPLLLGHEGQLPEPGSVLVMDRMGIPLLIARDKDGTVRGFANVCRHRGVRLVKDEGACKKSAFTCPYHGWTYNLDGTLRGVPMQAETFPSLDKATRSLAPIPLEVRHGMIWARLEVNGKMDLDAHLAGMGPEFDALGLKDQVFFAEAVSTRKTNWKSVMDAFLESYHIKRLHRDTIGPFFLDCMSYMEPIGDHIRSAVARNEIEEARALPPEQWDTRRHVTFAFTVFPNAVLVLSPDYTSILSLFPTAVDETQIVHTMVTPRPPADEKERDHWQRSFTLLNGGVFDAEDIFVSEQAQVGMRSGANDRFTCGLHEHGMRVFHETLDRITGIKTVELL